MMTAYDAIVAASKLPLPDGEYIRFDPRSLAPGDVVPRSYVWHDGERTNRMMVGTSALDPRACLTNYDVYNLKGTQYDGIPYVVSGQIIRRGHDTAEVILRNAVVIRHL